jgi:pimeloyl-ACP methyl ester carboxylesterase
VAGFALFIKLADDLSVELSRLSNLLRTGILRGCNHNPFFITFIKQIATVLKMNLDIVFTKGDLHKPAIIFIHGLGMDKNIWVDPSKSRILGGGLPLDIFLRERPDVKDFGLSKNKPKKEMPELSTGVQPKCLETLFNDLKLRKYSVVTWSQRRPSGPIESVVSELEEIMKLSQEMTKAGIILVGHSRGGLIGRKYLFQKKEPLVRGLITISSPHQGSSVARLVCYLKPAASFISPFFGKAEKGTLSSAIRHVLDFLKSRSLKELLPESSFLRSLKDGPLDWVHYISFGGTSPNLFSLYRWRWNSFSEGESQKWFLTPEELFSIPEIFQKVIPNKFYPDEIREGKGDGLVSAESSKIPWSYAHYNFSLNHAQMLFDKGVRDLLVKSIEKIS